MTKQELAIDVQHVNFSYNSENVLDDVTLAVEPGAYLGLLGPNGGGKTTLMKIILGLIEPENGSIKIFGKTPQDARREGKIGYVPQRIAQGDSSFPATVEEIVRSGRTPIIGIGGLFRQSDANAVEEALHAAGVHHLRHRLVGQLSGGERQKVFIARALASRPKILILDEPTTGVDIGAKEAFYTLLKELNTKHGITIVFISHDLEVVTKHATCAACLNQKIVVHCSEHAFLHDPEVRKLYGDSFSFVHHDH